MFQVDSIQKTAFFFIFLDFIIIIIIIIMNYYCFDNLFMIVLSSILEFFLKIIHNFFIFYLGRGREIN